MTRLRQAAWAIPVTLGALVAALAIAVVVARQKRQPPTRSAAPQVSAEHQSTSTQAVRFGTDATYGAGLTHVVPNPVASLRSTLGHEWRKLGRSVGRVLIRPNGTQSRYFEVSTVAVVRHGSARLEILTSEGQRSIELVRTGPYQVTNFGPLLAPKRGRIGLALNSVQPQSSSAGPSLVLSPLQAEYLTKGEWVTGMPALAEIGPGGLRGVSLGSGTTTRFAMTPGIGGRCRVTLQGASTGGTLRVTVTVGHEIHSALVHSRPTVVYIGPFSHTSSVLSMTVSTPAGKSNGSLFVSDMRFVAAQP